MSLQFERLQRALPRRYTLVHEIDRGGMSRVYLTRESHPERDVAIKVLDEQITSRAVRERFVREVERTARLAHPHIVPVYAAGEADGLLYYVVPYIEGGSLRDRLDIEGQLSVDDARTITLEIADALEYAHARGIIHRDIKPANVLFQGGHAVVADFGIARALAEDGGGTPTRMGVAFGSAEYLSPEQAPGSSRPVDHRSDIYALGCLLYEMLAGEPPFHDRTPRATPTRHAEEPVLSLRAVRPEVSPGLEEVVLRCLEKSPDDRFQSAAEVRGALDAVLHPKSEARARADRRTFLEWGRILRWPARIGGPALAVVALALAWNAWRPEEPVQVAGPTGYLDSVAVMPLDNQSGDSGLDYLGRSLADGIIGDLSRMSEVKVSARHSVERLWQADLTIPRLLDTLHVAHLLQGSFTVQDDELVVRVGRLDRTGTQLETQTYRAPATNLFEAEATISRKVTEHYLDGLGLAPIFAGAGAEEGPGRQAYLLGGFWLGRRISEGMKTAIRQYREAIRVEPDYAPAYAGLSSAYALSLYYKYNVGIPEYELAARALITADRAIALDSTLANGYAARGYIRALLGIEPAGAAEDFERARALAPNAPNGPSWSARTLAQQGRIAAAFREAMRARDLDPLQSGRRTAVATLAFQMGELTLSIKESRAALNLEPGLMLARAFEGRAMALTGEAPACAEMDFGPYRGVQALCLRLAGDSTQAAAIVDSLELALRSDAIDDPSYAPVLRMEDLVAYYAQTGDEARGMRWLREAYRHSPTGVDNRMLMSPLLDPLRRAPGFEDELVSIRRGIDTRIRSERRRVEREG